MYTWIEFASIQSRCSVLSSGRTHAFVQQIMGTWYTNFDSANCWHLDWQNARLLMWLGTKSFFVSDDGFLRNLILEDAAVLRAVEPSQIRLLHFLAIAHVREFMAEEVDGQLSFAKAARPSRTRNLERGIRP